MARLQRITAHITQRHPHPYYPEGNNRQVCFGSDANHAAFAEWLKEYSQKYHVDVHAWVMMANHVHLLCTPRKENGISQMMQDLGGRYVRYFNYEYKRTGTFWDGRYKSCLIQSDRYLLDVYRYIELNHPVRVGIVSNSKDYRWSSYRINALGNVSDLCIPHPEYLNLGGGASDKR